MTSTLAPYHVPHTVMQTILGSVGGALEVAARAGGILSAELGTWPAPPSPAAWGLTVGGLRGRGRLPGALLTPPSREPPDGE